MGFPVIQSFQKRNFVSNIGNNNNSHPPLVENDSDDDSLFNLIQQDLAAVKQEREEASKVGEDLDTATSVGEQPTSDDVLSVSSPLSERNENATFDDEIKSPKSPTTLMNTSMASFKETASMPQPISEIISTSDEESFKDALTITATASSNSDYVVLNKAAREHENDLVVSEASGVEVIAWN